MRAILLTDNPAAADPIRTCCARKNVELTVTDRAERALEICAEDPPDLVIVEDGFSAVSGPAFIKRVLKISWAVSSILITDDDEDRVHEKCEGLGILGSIADHSDTEGLERLLDGFASMQTGGRPAHG
jgi:DNA-binding response OmpR family regulator